MKVCYQRRDLLEAGIRAEQIGCVRPLECARTPGQDLAALLVDAKDPRSASESHSLEMSVERVGSAPPGTSRSTNGVADAHHVRGVRASDKRSPLVVISTSHKNQVWSR